MTPMTPLAVGNGAQRKRNPMNYADFITRKSQLESDGGFAPLWSSGKEFDFQSALVDWSLRKGRGAIFADCGLGKSLIELTWAENVARHTNKPTLILTPLAVAGQTVREGVKFGIEAKRADDGVNSAGVYVTNYDRLHHLDASMFGGVAADESSILKNFDGATKDAVTQFMRKVPYRLLCTATAAPNDYIELGTSSEALGYLGHMDMLNRFFKNDRDNSSTGRAWAMQGGGQPK